MKPILRLFWYLLKLGLVVAALLWLVSKPGQIDLSWFGYRIEMPAGFLAGGVLLLLVFVLGLYRIGHWLARLPRQWRHGRERRHWRKAKQAVLLGLMAQQLGDRKASAKYLRQVRPLLAKDPLLTLLEAQAALRARDEKEAQEKFRLLHTDPLTREIAEIGLFRLAIRKGDEEEAWKWAQKIAMASSIPPELLPPLLRLALLHRDWPMADHLLTFMDPNERERERAALAAEQARLAFEKEQAEDARRLAKKALQADKDFLPAKILFFQALLKIQKRKRAANFLKTEWKNPHPSFLPVFFQWSQEMDPLSRARAGSDFIAQSPHHPVSLLLGARLSLDAQLWGEARRYLQELAAKEEPSFSMETCSLFADLEERQGNEAERRKWLDRMRSARQDPHWQCSHCLHSPRQWSLECPQCGSIGTVIWTEMPAGEKRLLSAAGT